MFNLLIDNVLTFCNSLNVYSYILGDNFFLRFIRQHTRSLVKMLKVKITMLRSVRGRSKSLNSSSVSRSDYQNLKLSDDDGQSQVENQQLETIHPGID